GGHRFDPGTLHKYLQIRIFGCLSGQEQTPSACPRVGSRRRNPRVAANSRMLCDRPNSRRSPSWLRVDWPICRGFRTDNNAIPHTSRNRVDRGVDSEGTMTKNRAEFGDLSHTRLGSRTHVQVRGAPPYPSSPYVFGPKTACLQGNA